MIESMSMTKFLLVATIAFLFQLSPSLAVTRACIGESVQNCTLKPLGIPLSNQVFCEKGANKEFFERPGYDCKDLQYCCFTVEDFGNIKEKYANSMRLVGSRHSITGNGEISLPAGRTVRLEFTNEVCIGEVVISGSKGTVKITRYYLTGTDSNTLISLADTNNSPVTHPVNECKIAAISVTAPATSSITIVSLGFCNLDTACASTSSKRKLVRSQASLDSNVIDTSSSPVAVQEAPTVQVSNVSTNNWWPCQEIITAPIVPSINCSHHIPNSDYCLTVWNYENPSPYLVFDFNFTGNSNEFIREPIATEFCGVFSPGIVLGEVATVWDCKTYQNIHQTWSVTSLVSPFNGDSDDNNVGYVTKYSQVHRTVNNCPQNLVCEFLTC